MGILSGRIGYARHRYDAHRNHDRRKPQTGLRRCAGLAASLIITGYCAIADPLRIATFNSELSQRGPGLLLREILNETEQVTTIARMIGQHSPDILVLQSFDYDAQNIALKAFGDLLSKEGVHLPFVYSPRPNTGIPTGIDIDGDGQKNGPRDAQGYGWYPGDAGIALLSRYPIVLDEIQNFSGVLWEAAAPNTDLKSLLPTDAINVQRLHSVAAIAVPVQRNGQPFWVLTHHATPPVFDGPEDRNGYRNAEENRFWLDSLRAGFPPAPYILAAQLNLDPNRGEGHRSVISEIVASEFFQDPFSQWPTEDNHTVTYSSPGPGNLRVSYVLPSPDLQVTKVGMSEESPVLNGQSRHRLVWVDIVLPE